VLGPDASKRTWMESLRHCRSFETGGVGGFELPSVADYEQITGGEILTRKGRYWTKVRIKDEDRNFTLALTVTTNGMRTTVGIDTKLYATCVYLPPQG
jgi:hypothetical protein